MPIPFSKWRRLRLPSRIALLLGLGALSAAGARADTAAAGIGGEPMRVPQQSAKSFGEVSIWSDGGRIYVAEPGQEARDLGLGDTPEARHLRALLERDGATATSPRVLPDRLILVGGGGNGFYWAPAGKNDAAVSPSERQKPSAPATADPPPPRPSPPNQTARSQG